jgi:hypothetical protein
MEQANAHLEKHYLTWWEQDPHRDAAQCRRCAPAAREASRPGSDPEPRREPPSEKRLHDSVRRDDIRNRARRHRRRLAGSCGESGEAQRWNRGTPVSGQVSALSTLRAGQASRLLQQAGSGHWGEKGGEGWQEKQMDEGLFAEARPLAAPGDCDFQCDQLKRPGRKSHIHRLGYGGGAKAKVRPIQGNSPRDRLVSRGFRSLSRVCDDPFPATSSHRFKEPILRAPSMRFEGMAESIGPMLVKPNPGGGTGRLPDHERRVPPTLSNDKVTHRLRLEAIGPVTQAKERVGRTTLLSSSAMSSDRLFLDRVARQHCPSPLHRHPQITTHSSQAQAKGDISTLLGRGHFYFALTRRRKPLRPAGHWFILPLGSRHERERQDAKGIPLAVLPDGAHGMDSTAQVRYCRWYAYLRQADSPR